MISEVTKRNIFDELKIRNTNWSGRLDEVEFLNRLFDIESLSGAPVSLARPEVH